MALRPDGCAWRHAGTEWTCKLDFWGCGEGATQVACRGNALLMGERETQVRCEGNNCACDKGGGCLHVRRVSGRMYLGGPDENGDRSFWWNVLVVIGGGACSLFLLLERACCLQ